MNKKMKLALFVSLIGGVVFLAACSAKDLAGETVTAYLEAVVTGNADRMSTLVCDEFSADAALEMDAFVGVQASLESPKCTETGTDGDTRLVTCSGKIVATYGNEQQEFDLAGPTYRVVQQGQELLVCGRQ